MHIKTRKESATQQFSGAADLIHWSVVKPKCKVQPMFLRDQTQLWQNSTRVPACLYCGLAGPKWYPEGCNYNSFYYMQTWKILTSFRLFIACTPPGKLAFQKIIGEKTVPYVTIPSFQLCLVTFLPSSCKVLHLDFLQHKDKHLTT